MPFCAQCGSEHTAGVKFCSNCGASLGAEEAESPVTEEEAPAVRLDEDEHEVWHGSPDPKLSPLDARSTRYVVTNERIRVFTGKLRKKSESMELFRVKDVSVEKLLRHRARHRGDVVITSTDPSTPEVVFESVERPDEVAETIRKLVRRAREEQGVRAREEM